MKKIADEKPTHCRDDFVISFLISETNGKWLGCAKPWISRTYKSDIRDNPLNWSLLMDWNGAI